MLIILLWVPPGPPSSCLPAALPKPCRRRKAQREMSVARLSPISQNENNDWLFLWASLEKKSCIVGWDGGGIFASGSNSNQESSGMYIHCDPFHPSSDSPGNSEDGCGSGSRKDAVTAKPASQSLGTGCKFTWVLALQRPFTPLRISRPGNLKF